MNAIVDLAFTALWVLVLIRIIISWVPSLNYSNPVFQAVILVVDPMLKPFRKITPHPGGADFSPLALILFIHIVADFVDALLDSVLSTQSVHYSLASEILKRVFELFGQIALIFIFALGVRILIVILQGDEFHPATMLMRQLTDPLTKPFRKIAGSPTRSALVSLVFYVVVYVVIIKIGANFQLSS